VPLARQAVFLDRDGVINENRRDYVRNWEEFEFLPGALASLCRLAEGDHSVIIISNQSAINRGLVSRSDVDRINQRMVKEIEKAGGRIDGIYVCPHRPDEGCDCRKPKPGLLYQAVEELGIDLTSSYLVGDALSDMGAALAARCTPFLVLTGRGRQELARARDSGFVDFVYASDLTEAVDWIVGLSNVQP
jgi:D-glycero-D-manno-heptose 1,7-bisphosphate phosphatase